MVTSEDRPQLSICTVTFNAAAELPRALASVAAARRDFADCEYLIVDGASTDDTCAVIAQNRTVVDRWISEPDRGIYDAMNKAAHLARGDYVYFLGADDELEPSLGVVAPHLDGAAVVYGDVWLAGEGRRYDGAFDRRKLLLRNICHQALFYPRRLLLHHGFEERYPLLADHALNMKLWARGVRFRHVDVVVARFRDAGRSAAGDPAFERDRPGLIRRWFGAADYCWYRYRMSRNLLKRKIAGEA